MARHEGKVSLPCKSTCSKEELAVPAASYMIQAVWQCRHTERGQHLCFKPHTSVSQRACSAQVICDLQTRAAHLQTPVR